ncbi:MAG: hypothetical protein AABX38_05920 [Candidatus Micrarchaeota archaeon]
MVLANICAQGAQSTVASFIYPLVLSVSVFAAIVIGLAYMLGQSINNPKVTLWAKTEAVQLVVSAIAAVIILQSVGVFCTIDAMSIYQLFNVPPPQIPQVAGQPQSSISIYNAAELYLVTGGSYVKSVADSARYHLGGYNMLQSFGRNLCLGSTTSPVSGFLNIIFCLYGNGIIGGGSSSAGIGTGTSIRPDSGYGFLSAAVGFAFNSALFSYVSILNYLFIFKYIFSGFVLFFLPLGIFFRSFPYLRGFGSLLMSVSIAFLFVYPLMLAFFYIDIGATNSILAPKNSPALLYSSDSPGKVGIAAVTGFKNSIYDDVFDKPSSNNGEQSFEVLKLTGNAFLVGVFIPSLALLSAAAAVSYINRFLGEEVDLSRIVQIV